MASVYLGRLKAAAGIRKLRAIKRAHPHLAEDEAFRQLLIREARLASRIAHPNVVSVQDAEEVGQELLVVLDYIEGVSLGDLLSALRKLDRSLEVEVALRIALDAAAGLQAAHELTDDRGKPLGLIHRDVTPHNILVGLDGISRITDFGIAKCVESVGEAKTATGTLRGKSAYMAPEYLRGREIDARADVFALGVVVWEMLAGKRLFRAETEIRSMQRALLEPAPSLAAWGICAELDAAIARALSKSPEARFPTVRAFMQALLEAASSVPPADRCKVSALVEELFGPVLAERREAANTLEPLELRIPEAIVSDPTRVALTAGASADAPRSSRWHRRLRGAWPFAIGAVLASAVAGAWLAARIPKASMTSEGARDVSAPAGSVAPLPVVPSHQEKPLITAPASASIAPRAATAKPRAGGRPRRPAGSTQKHDVGPNPYGTAPPTR